MDTLTLIIILQVLILLLLMLLWRQRAAGSGVKELQEQLETLRQERQDQDLDLKADVGRIVRENMATFTDVLGSTTRNMGALQTQQFTSIDQHLQDKTEQSQKLVRETLTQSLTRVEERLGQLQLDNNAKLDQMRSLVDEKLQKTLNERMTQSFKLVSDRLEQVYRGLGEMQNLAQGVGDLKKVLSNVKTRGILGEIQLGAILQEILAPEQYAVNIATREGSREVVEFAVKLPTENGGFVYLPLDSKFPGETYSRLRDAYDTGDPTLIQEAAKMLDARLKQEAKDIHDKYLDPPHTTEFGILFLPFEGLYAEVVNRGLVEVLQRDYQVNIAGPSTMAALLNSLQMGFKTFAIQKRSGEVWQVLGAVKTEFDKFEEALRATQNRLNQANDELDKLVGTRTRKMQQKLKQVTELSGEEAARVLQLDEGKED
jgi:DNA recombination protein RmuC